MDRLTPLEVEVWAETVTGGWAEIYRVGEGRER